MQTAETNIQQNTYDIGQARGDITALGTIVNGKLDKPTNTGDTGDVIVKTATGSEWQAVAPFNPNAEYPGVTAGKAIVAKNLEAVSENSGSLQDEPFFFQATATENNTTSTPTAPQFELKSLRGNTIVYNQLVDGINLTYPTISGHKYWSYISATDYTSVWTSAGTSVTVSDAQKDKIVDLTRWFNGSIPQAILDDPTVFPINYYDGELTYSAGELKNCSCTELNTVGFNQWDEVWELGSIAWNTGEKQVDNTRIRSKNYINVVPNVQYYFNTAGQGATVCWYDSEHNYIATEYPNNETKTSPKNARYMMFSPFPAYGNVYNNDICINLSWDGERDGTYEPYISHTYPMVWSGKSAGSAYDEKLPDGTEITRVGSVDLGSLTWAYVTSATYPRFVAQIPTKKSGSQNIICSEYALASWDDLTSYPNFDKSIGADYNSASIYIGVRDSDYTDAVAFKTAMSGVMVYYELATPTTSSGDAYTSVIEGNDYGTMGFDSVVPVGNEFFYQADYALLIDDLGNYVNYDVTDIVKYSDFPIPAPPTSPDGTYKLIATVSGGTATLSWTADS